MTLNVAPCIRPLSLQPSPIGSRSAGTLQNSRADAFLHRMSSVAEVACRVSRLIKQTDNAITKRVLSSSDRLGLRMTNKSLETWRKEARKGLDRNGHFKTELGRHVWMYRQLARDLEDAGYDAEKQAATLLQAVSEDRLSHLAHGTAKSSG